MKQLVEFESWIDNIIKEDPRMGQTDKAIGDRPIARSQDIVYQAQRKYPDRSTDQALSLYINDKMVDSEKMDLEQNKLINSQKRENEKLRRSLTDLSNELHSHEQTAMDTEKEVQRLRDLSSKLKPASELQQQAVKASTEQVERMLNDLNQIKDKSNIGEKQFNELRDQIEKAQKGISKQNLQSLMAMMAEFSKSEKVDPQDLQNAISQFKKEQQETLSSKLGDIQKSEAERVQAEIKKLKDRMKEFEEEEKQSITQDLEQKLARKEQRFKNYVKSSSQAIKNYDEKYRAMAGKADEILNKLDQAETDAVEKIDRLYALIGKVNPDTKKQAIQKISPALSQASTQVDKDEVEQNWVSAANEPFSLDPEQELDLKSQPEKEEDDMEKITDLLKSKKLAEEVDQDEEKMFYHLINIYKAKYPQDLNQWTEEQLKEIMRRTIGGGLLIYQDDVDNNRIYNYLDMVRRWLRKSRPRNPEFDFGDESGGMKPMREPMNRQRVPLPNQPREKPAYEWPPSKDSFSESLVHEYNGMLTKLTNGY